MRHRSQVARAARRRLCGIGLHCRCVDCVPDILHVWSDAQAKKVSGAEGRRRWSWCRCRCWLHERSQWQWQHAGSLQHWHPQEGLQEGGTVHRSGVLTSTTAGRIYSRGSRDHRVICCRRLWHVRAYGAGPEYSLTRARDGTGTRAACGATRIGLCWSRAGSGLEVLILLL